MSERTTSQRVLAALGAGALLATFGAASLAATPGCSIPPVGCTLIGCESQVSATIANVPQGPLTIDMALDGTTVTFAVDLASGALGMCTPSDTTRAQCSLGQSEVTLTTFLGGDFEAESVQLRVTVKDGAGTTLLDQQKTLGVLVSQPNGEDCDPTCHQATTEFTL